MVKTDAKGLSLLASIVFVGVLLVASCAPESSRLAFQPHIDPETIQPKPEIQPPEFFDMPLEPHLNPGAAAQVYSDTYLMRYVSLAHDAVLASKPLELERLRQRLGFATIRPEAVEATRSFLTSATSLSVYLAASKTNMDAVMALMAQNRLQEARDKAYATQEQLAQAQRHLEEMRKSVRDLGRILAIARAAEDSELRHSYDEVTQHLATVEQAVGTVSQFLKGEDIEVVLKELQARPEMKALVGSMLVKTEDIEGTLMVLRARLNFSNLKPTELSLELSPARVFVGKPVSFWGRLTSGGAGLPERDITLDLEGAKRITVKTGPDGRYSSEVTLPYKYDTKTAVQASYSPVAGDSLIYLGITSRLVEVETPFYSSWMDIAPAAARPGLNAVLKGRFASADPPMAGTRRLDVFVDGSLAASATVGEDFQAEVPVPPEMAPGRHHIKVVTQGQDRYGPASAETSLDVARATPVVDLRMPRLLLIPLGLNIEGTATSEVGPLKAARIGITFGPEVAEVVTAEDGSFSYRLSPGFLLALVGQQGLEVKARPVEPWNDAASTRKNVIVLNPVGLAIVLVATALAGRWVSLRRRAKLSALPAKARTPEPATRNLAAESSIPSGRAWAGKEPLAGDKGKVVQMYRRVVSSIVARLAVMIRPQMTLREIASELAPRIGKISSYLWQMTFIAERAVYSRHSVTAQDKSDAEKLSTQVTEGVNHETT